MPQSPGQKQLAQGPREWEERCSGPRGLLLRHLPPGSRWKLSSCGCQVGAGQGAEAEDIPQGIVASGGRVEGGPDSPGERGYPLTPLTTPWVPVTGKGAF